MEITQEVIAGRRITIPKAVAKAMGIEEGDIITIKIKEVVKGVKNGG